MGSEAKTARAQRRAAEGDEYKGGHALRRKFVAEPVFQLASAETSVSESQRLNTARRERHRHTSTASQSVPPNHHQARTRVTHILFLHVTVSILAATTAAAAAGEATRDKYQGEEERPKEPVPRQNKEGY